MSSKNNKDNEVYILGSDIEENKKKSTTKLKWIIIFCICLIVAIAGIIILLSDKEQAPEYYFEPEISEQQSVTITTSNTESSENQSYTSATTDTINDVPLNIFVTHNAMMSLTVGMPDRSDSTIIFAAMAADIRKDNQEIVGDFVLSGNQITKGVAKKGFCAIINNTISIGVGEDTPLLQQAIENKGFFFRQYPLVLNGELIENRPKNKSIRRALAMRNEQIIMIESQNTESFHDFTQALIDIGVSDAIYLVGGDAYGWYRDKEQTRNEFGKELTEIPQNISYIVWRTQ
ncbi:hypothetical protein [Dysgonomonas sp. 520]|uniref:hypothetical protein n=1 Tax=Dysgonomonas sp. 520 TaxID=2302931 RepID=UPI0013D36AEC|nr:hypothetical protein [Dysgonomonas sp. 520]NDW09778.1 hypothetical protein [Dysgonomonas sp. 520]